MLFKFKNFLIIFFFICIEAKCFSKFKSCFRNDSMVCSLEEPSETLSFDSCNDSEMPFLRCSFHCHQTSNCIGFNYYNNSGARTVCEIYNSISKKFREADNCTFFAVTLSSDEPLNCFNF